MPYLIPRSDSVALDGDGNGQVTFAIDNTNQRWIIDTVSVQTSQAPTATPIPQAMVFLDDTTPQGLQGGTFAGSMDTAAGRCILYPDNMMIVAWTGGVPGTTATATIAGTFDPAGVPLQD